MVDRPGRVVAPLTITAIEPVRSGQGGGARARVVTAAWLVALVGVAGFAVAGRLTEPGLPTVPIVAVAPPPGSSTPVPTGAPSGMRHLATTDDELIVLTSPAKGDPTITAVELIVQGYLQADAESVRVSVEMGELRVDEATIRPALAFGERPTSTRHAQFLVRFALPDPRPTDPMVVRVVAFDLDGQRLAVIRRPFRVGPIDRPTLGDDGILGGLVF